MTPAALVAALLAAAAAALQLAPPAALSRCARPAWRGSVLAAAVIAALVVPADRWPLGVIVLGAALGAGRLWRARRRRLAAAAVAARVVETCEQLAAELASGQSPGAALDRCAREWPPLGTVAEAFRMGADVPAAWRTLARSLPGAADLRLVAAAWQVSLRTGQGLALAVDRIALDLRAAVATREVVAGELASARATARMVGLLPVAALVMGSGVGGDPWGFLLTTPVGVSALALGLLFAGAGLAWIERIAAEAAG